MKKDEIMVSIICPVYNKAEYVRQGMESILSQEFDFPYEILVGEDCSTDNSLEILQEYERKYPDKIKVFHREENLKQSKNVYDLFTRSKGKYVMILDLDDYWTDEQKLEKQISFLETHPEYVGVVHDFQVVDKAGNPIDKKEERKIEEYLDKDIHLEDFLEYGFIFQTATLCYRNIWKENWDYSILYKADDTVVDLTINTMLLQKTPIFVLKDCMSAYRLVLEEEASNARSVNKKDIAKSFEKQAKQVEALYHYFEKKVDFSTRWSWLVTDYLKGIMNSGDKRYKKGVFLKMYFTSSAATKKKVHQWFSETIKRKLGK